MQNIRGQMWMSFRPSTFKSACILGCCFLIFIVWNIFSPTASELYQALGTEASRVGKYFDRKLEKKTYLQTESISRPIPHGVGFQVRDKDGKELRCKSRSMGCFELASSTKNTFHSQQSSLPACLLDCSNRTYRYFGKFKNICHCANDTRGWINILSWEICPVSSNSKTDQIKIFEVFLITERCHPAFSSNNMAEQFSVGCLFLPEGNPVMHDVYNIVSLKHCIIFCEDGGYSLALFRHWKTKCLCSYPQRLFPNASLLQNMLVNCEDSHDKELFHIYNTHEDNSFCSSRKFLQQDESPVTILASTPGSGNTWTRYLLEVATGIYSGSSYGDSGLRKGGFLGESMSYKSGRTLVVKDHYLKNTNRRYERGVILLRNPFHSLLAEYHRKHSRGHIGVAKNIKPDDFKAFIMLKLHDWYLMQERYFENINSDKIIVYYEDLKKDMVSQMKRIINFFPKELIVKYIPDVEQRLVCMVLDHTGQFKRSSERSTSDQLFDEEVVNAIQKQVENVNKLLEKYGFGHLPESYKQP